jgi:phosphoglycerate dehydrogenase-like enzyme
MDSVIRKSDIIILCCSKKRGEQPIIDDSKIGKMKGGVVLVNPVRADLVNNGDIIRRLKSRKIFTYAVDEKTGEFNTRTVEPGRIIETGHTAWYSTEALERGMKEWADAIIGLCDDNDKGICLC